MICALVFLSLQGDVVLERRPEVPTSECRAQLHKVKTDMVQWSRAKMGGKPAPFVPRCECRAKPLK